ncbi:tetratricopeptide repeat protein, partial [Thermodesulfobacteriota bacterium]
AFPLVGKIYTESVSKVGESIGFAYMLNTVGSLLGSFCAGFLLIPIAGKESSLKMIVSLQLVTSLVVAIVMIKNRKGRIVQFGFTAMVAATGLVLCFFYPVWNHQQLAIGKYHRFHKFRQSLTNVGWLESLLHGPKILAKSDEGELVYYGDGIGGFTTVLMKINALGNTNYSMMNSGKVDASTSGDMATQTLSAHFPMLFHKNPKTVMVVGLASGITAGEVLYYPVKQLDILEINDQVISASDFFVKWNNKVLADPKTNLIIQDARAHLQHTGQKYDVIISEPSNPWMAGLAALFTYEYFSLVRDRLNDGGVFVQWLQAYQMDWETFATVGRTFIKNFPNSILVNTKPSIGGSDFLLVGFKNKDRLELGHAEQNSGYVRESKNVTILDTRLLYRLIVSENLQRLFGQGVINTDNRPLLEFAAPRLMYFSDAAVFQKKIKERTILSAETQKMVWETATNVDAQIDNAAFALSVKAPFSHMVDLSKATSLQKDRFFNLVGKYCASNEFNASVFKNNELNQRCLSVQIETINSRLDRLSDRWRLWSYLGNLYMETRRTSEAVNCFSEALRIDPENMALHNNLAIALAKQGRTAEAIEHYLQALRIKPDYEEVHNNLGNALAKQGRTAEAIEHYLQALRIKPDYGEAHNNLAIALAKQGRTAEAIEHYLQALRTKPDSVGIHNNLGNALNKQGRTAEAIEHYLQALRIKPDYEEVHNNLGNALNKQGRTAEAIEHYLQALRIKPDYGEAHNNLGNALAKQGRTAEAIEHYLQALRIKPDYWEAHHNLAIALFRTGNIEGAITHFRNALRINPDNIHAKNNLKKALMMHQKNK